MKIDQIKKLKPKTLLKISPSALKFWDREALSLCSRSSGMTKEDELDYLLRKSIGRGVPYKCYFIELIPTGVRVNIELTKNYAFKTILETRDVKLLQGENK